MAKYVAESTFIASIYPGELPPITKYVGPEPSVYDKNGKANSRATVYRLKPVPRGSKQGYFSLEITDAFELVPNPMKAAESSRGDRKGANMIFDTNLVTCEEIANGLMQEWVGNMVKMPVGASPGIMIVANSAPTQANLETMHQMQTVYAEHMYAEAQRLSNANLIEKITQPMKDMAKWLGREPVWIPRAVDMIACPECRKDIPADTRVCQYCRTRLQPMSAEVAKLNQQPVGA